MNGKEESGLIFLKEILYPHCAPNHVLFSVWSLYKLSNRCSCPTDSQHNQPIAHFIYTPPFFFFFGFSLVYMFYEGKIYF